MPDEIFEDDVVATTTTTFPETRLRRLRTHPKLRELVRETRLNVNDLVMPIFIKAGRDIKQPITSMPGMYQLSLDHLADEIKEIVSLKIPAILLFGIPEHKDSAGSAAYDDNGVVQKAIRFIKELAPELLIIADLCFCEYTDHGHCGVVIEKNEEQFDVDNDQTLALLARQAVSLANAGADVIAPSGMMDGMVKILRQNLDHQHLHHVPILSYAVKFASGFYGPFREAAEGAPQFGDRATYQMDIANGNEALREAAMDVNEGADMLMVKPAQNYLDIVCRVKQQFPNVPLSAYQVSGEYSMIKAAAANDWIDETRIMLESLICIKRAGADFIITYFAKDAARALLTQG